MSRDRYKETVFLPKADFPMRAGLPVKEPELLQKWQDEGLYQKIAAARVGQPPFILHDGPPYANGHIHIGHAINKILKDITNRAQLLLGKRISYVPGWDCHGLPIEWKIEEKLRAEGKNKEDVPVLQFREECRNFAQKWVDIQTKEFQRLGILGEWDNPYLTMTPAAEACIAAEIHKFLMNGSLYQGTRPVMWSTVEKTALAEAEIEYHEHKSIMIWVRFPIKKASLPALENTSLLIWTTTPWTIPGNRAVACSAQMEYGVYEVKSVAEGSLATIGERLLVATSLQDAVKIQAKIEDWDCRARFTGAEMAGTLCAHPFSGQGYDFDVPLLEADFVTAEQGTGLVHIAPGHGADDFVLGKTHALEIPRTVDEQGRFYESVPLFAGKSVYTDTGEMGDANGAVIKALKESDSLLCKGSLRHSYPHSWRSKAPLIFRTTPQWFVSMDNLREKALSEIKKTQWIPPQSRNRIEAMVRDRPDWCISRQRSWGVPIALFLSKKDGAPLKDPQILNRIIKIFEQEGADAWFAREAADFLGDSYNPDDYEQVMDIVDVWFESGSSHAFVLEDRDTLVSPASLYLEGSDQHRGWFQSSLLESCGTRGKAPFEAVFTHGFVLDNNGRKMSKSSGNVMAPQEIIDQSGADILRLWVMSVDYHDDVRIGAEILKNRSDMYRRFRNTLRYLIGNLDGFSEAERVDVADIPELEQWVLHRIAELSDSTRESFETFSFQRLSTMLHHFCAVELSAFYFDVRKDSFYCDDPHSLRRRSARTVLDILFSHLTAWLAPVLCFTAEEAWQARGHKDSVHLRTLPLADPSWKNEKLAQKWDKIRSIRRVVTGAIEKKREKKELRSSLEAHVHLYLAADDRTVFDSLNLPEIIITSAATLEQSTAPDHAFTLEEVPGVAVVVDKANGEKCERCWQISLEVEPKEAALCKRCADYLATSERGVSS